MQRIKPKLSEPYEYIAGDVRRSLDVENAVNGCNYVYNLAYLHASVDPVEVSSINGDGAKVVAEACAKAGVQRLIHLSTAEVYGNPARTPTDESTVCRPLTRPARSKLQAELYLEQVHKQSGLPITIFRPTTILGARTNSPIFWHLFENVRKRRVQHLVGSGKNRIHLLDPDDCVNALLAATDSTDAFAVYNLGGPDAITLKEACRCIYEWNDDESQIRILSEPPHHMVSRIMSTSMRLELLGTYLLQAEADFVLDTRAACASLGWQPKAGAKTILTRAYADHLRRVTKPR